MKVKRHRIDMRYRCGAYRGEPYGITLCLSELRKFVDINKGTMPITLVLTNKKPRGNNYHRLSYSSSQWDSNWRLRDVDGGSPGFYPGFEEALTDIFGTRAQVYAWIEQAD